MIGFWHCEEHESSGKYRVCRNTVAHLLLIRPCSSRGCVWHILGFRARMASAAPSMGLRRDHIGFRPLFLNFHQKCKKMHFWRGLTFSIDVPQIFNRSSIDLRQMFDRCSIDVLSIFDRLSIDLGWICRDLARSGEIRRDLARSGEIWRDLARSGEIW